MSDSRLRLRLDTCLDRHSRLFGHRGVADFRVQTQLSIARLLIATRIGKSGQVPLDVRLGVTRPLVRTKGTLNALEAIPGHARRALGTPCSPVLKCCARSRDGRFYSPLPEARGAREEASFGRLPSRCQGARHRLRANSHGALAKVPSLLRGGLRLGLLLLLDHVRRSLVHGLLGDRLLGGHRCGPVIDLGQRHRTPNGVGLRIVIVIAAIRRIPVEIVVGAVIVAGSQQSITVLLILDSIGPVGLVVQEVVAGTHRLNLSLDGFTRAAIKLSLSLE